MMHSPCDKAFPARVTVGPVDDAAAMGLALEEARAALAHDDVPIGAVVVVGGEVVARRHNERERTGDPTAHAELLALRDAAAAVGGGWRLVDATLVVTIEPCAMCAGALLAARVKRLVFGAPDLKAGACGSLYNLCTDPRLHHEIEVVTGVQAADAAALLESFFAELREKPPPDRQ
jgi:tRNA(adenine34) deaminase